MLLLLLCWIVLGCNSTSDAHRPLTMPTVRGGSSSSSNHHNKFGEHFLEEDPIPTTTSATQGIIIAAAAALADAETTTTTTAAEKETAAASDASNAVAVEADDTVLATTKDDEDDVEATDSASTTLGDASTSTLSDRQEQADQLRAVGKTQHDAKEFAAAATSFGQAADLLLPPSSSSMEGDGTTTDTAAAAAASSHDYPTLKLHQALCHLKSGQPELAIDACSIVLENDSTESVAIRARALLRRAKAYMTLGESTRALADARAAAFLGDPKAVALYGQWMRESSGSSSGAVADEGMNPTIMGGGGGGGLFESLLNAAGSGGASTSSAASITPSLFPSPSNLLGGLLQSGNGGSNNNALTKSVLASVSKRLSDESTHTMLSGVLQSVTVPQLQAWAGMAGLSSLPTSTIESIVTWCHSVTPRTLRRTVAWGHRGVYTVQLVRKAMAVVAKYKTVLVLWMLVWWTIAAVQRPLPGKTLRKLAEAAAAASCTTTAAM